MGIPRCDGKILIRKSLQVKYCGIRRYRRSLCRLAALRIGLGLGARFDCDPSTPSVKVVRHMATIFVCGYLWKTGWTCRWDWPAGLSFAMPAHRVLQRRKDEAILRQLTFDGDHFRCIAAMASLVSVLEWSTSDSMYSVDSIFQRRLTP